MALRSAYCCFTALVLGAILVAGVITRMPGQGPARRAGIVAPAGMDGRWEPSFAAREEKGWEKGAKIGAGVGAGFGILLFWIHGLVGSEKQTPILLLGPVLVGALLGASMGLANQPWRDGS